MNELLVTSYTGAGEREWEEEQNIDRRRKDKEHGAVKYENEKLRRERGCEGWGIQSGETVKDNQVGEREAGEERWEDDDVCWRGCSPDSPTRILGPASMMWEMISVFMCMCMYVHAPLCFLCNNCRDPHACGNWNCFAPIERICLNLYSQEPLYQDHLCFPPTL